MHQTLASVLSEKPDPRDVKSLVETASRMALAYLRRKAKTGTLRPDCFGLSLEDLALDSCADLFQRDEDGRYVALGAYFDAIDWRRMSDVDIQIALRRLVFSKVSEGLFRRYRENDPNLGKVIRNIKDVVRSMEGVRLERSGRRLWIVAGGDDRPLSNELPVAPPEILAAHVTAALGSCGETREAVSVFSTFVALHPHYRNGFPVSAFGQLVRAAFIRLGASLDSSTEADATEEKFTVGEVERAIETATDVVRRQMFSTYVSGKKIEGSTFALYVRAVRDVLESQYVRDTSSTISHFDVISALQPDISENEYRRKHRNRLEYMVRLARGKVAEFLANRSLQPAV